MPSAAAPRSFRRRLGMSAAIALVSGLATQAAADPGMPNGGITLSVEGRLLWHDGARQPWVQFNQPFNVPGEYRFVRIDESWSGTIAGTFQFADQWDIGAAYTGIRSRTGRQEIGDPGNPAYMGFLLVPAIGELRFGLFQGDVELRSRLDVVDFDAGFRTTLGQRLAVRVFAGLRYAQYRQDVKVTLRSLANTHNDETAESTFRGIGPRLGLTADLALAKTGSMSFGLHGGVAGAALFGRYNKKHATNYFPLNMLTTSLPSADEDEHSILNGEVSLGAHVAFPLGPWNARLSVGYRAEAWLGIENTQTVDPIAQPSTLSGNRVLGTTSGNLYQHGPYVRFSVDF